LNDPSTFDRSLPGNNGDDIMYRLPGAPVCLS
jgi:hypothetical protein